MYKKILFLLVLALTGKLVAQNAPPNGFLYQAVVRDANGNLAANRTIYVQIAIKKTTATGTTVYADNYVVRSNADAMFSIVIGQGTNKSGTYSNLLSIPWGSDKFFFNLKLCVAPTIPGTGWTPSYRDMGTTQLWSVPYAMFANKAQSSMDSLTLTASGNTRKLKLGNYTPIYFNVADQDSSKTNEIQTISRNGGRLLLNLNGGVISLPDSSALNELQTISRTGGRITLNQGGGTISLPDSSATNELQTISKTGSTISLSNGGGSVTDADNQNLSITAGKGTIQISGGNNIKLADSSAVNELQNLSLSSSGSNRNIGISNGNNIIVNVNDADSSATNELQTLSKTGNTVTLSNGGGNITVTDNQTLSSTGTGSTKTISIIGGNSVNINVNDADSSATNELQSISQSTNKGTVTLSKNGGSIVLPDSSAINELQTISKIGNTVTLSNGGGSIAVTDNQTLSATGTGNSKTISITGGNSVNINVNDADSSATNELQSISQSTNKGTVTLSKNGGSIVLPDSSATNELQNISKTGSTISLSNGGGSVTDADNQNLSITAGKGTIQIAGGNNIKLADSSATNELQNLSVSTSGSNRNIGISNGNNIIVNVNDADSSVTNELQSISQSTNKGTVTLSKNGGSIVLPDSSAMNELQKLTLTNNGLLKTIAITKGDSVTFSVNDGDTTYWKKNSTGIYYKVGRVGIGAANTEASSVLQVSSTSQGALMPRMTEAQRIAILSPALGLLVFQTNNTAGFYFYNGTAWVILGGGGSSNSGSSNNTLIYTSDGF
jgi:hypothetical protein